MGPRLRLGSGSENRAAWEAPTLLGVQEPEAELGSLSQLLPLSQPRQPSQSW